MPRLEEFEGVSVHYAATQVEAQMRRSDPMAVVGGGNSAGQAAVFLAQHTGRARLLIRRDDLGADMSRYLVDRIERDPRIEVLRHPEVRELVGQRGVLEALVVEDNRTGERRRMQARVLFVFIGAEPHVRWLGDQLAMDDKGFILTGPDAVRTEGERAAGRPRAVPARDQLCSPRATCAADRSSGSPRLSARAPWPSAWCTSTSVRYAVLRPPTARPRSRGLKPPIRCWPWGRLWDWWASAA